MTRTDKSTAHLLSDCEQASINISPFKIATDDLDCGDIELGELTDRDAMIPSKFEQVHDLLGSNYRTMFSDGDSKEISADKADVKYDKASAPVAESPTER